MKTIPVIFSQPPRLLLGVAFLFWGAMHDRALPALIAAILMEGRHWTKIRWEFGESGFARAWMLSLALLFVSVVIVLQPDDMAVADYVGMLSWLPFMMMPLALAQQYCSDPGTPMNTFSFIARRKMALDRREGRTVNVTYLNLGFPYLALILVTAGMGIGEITKVSTSGTLYLGGIALLVGTGMFAVGGGNRRPKAWIFAYFLSLFFAAGMLSGVVMAYRYLISKTSRTMETGPSATETQTAMGQVRELQLSDEIQWVYHQDEGPKPDLLPMASYNLPEGPLWLAGTRRANLREKVSTDRGVGGDFESLYEIGDTSYSYAEEYLERNDFPNRSRIIGRVRDQTLIPHLPFTRKYGGIDTEILAVNSLGATQLYAPQQAAMEITMGNDSDGPVIGLDPTDRDLTVPPKEMAGLESYLTEIGLHWDGPRDLWSLKRTEGNPQRSELIAKLIEGFQADKSDTSESIEFPNVPEEEFRRAVQRLRAHFTDDFTYTLELSINNQSRPINQFLNQVREGHCEYFASSTAMLLRRMGIPARYVIGYVVSEKGNDDGEYYLRGEHAHAWTQAYVGGTWRLEKIGDDKPVWRCRGGRWVEVDLTPASWLTGAGSRGLMQRLSDWFVQARNSLLVWWGKSSISSWLFGILMVAGIGGLIFLVYRLFKTRKREGSSSQQSWEERAGEKGMLHDFERWLAKRAGPRPKAVPMGIWLRDRLPQSSRESGDFIQDYEMATYHPGTSKPVIPDLENRIRELKKLVLASSVRHGNC